MSLILDLQTAVAARLTELQAAEDGLQALVITTEHKGSLDASIARRIQQASVGLVVSTPVWQAGETLRELVVDVALVVVENVPANKGQTGTRRSVTEIAEHIYAYLQDWQPTDESWATLDFQSWATRDADDEAQVLFHVMTFRTSTFTQTTE